MSFQIRNWRTLDQQLRVDRLGERVVERSLADVAHQPAHVRLDGEPDDAADDREHAHHDEQLRSRPPGEVVGLIEDQGQHDRARCAIATSDWSSWMKKFAR